MLADRPLFRLPFRRSQRPACDRVPLVDGFRGAAIVAMAAYHACWDMAYFGLAQFDLFESRFWLTARSVILISFLLVAGVSLVLANRSGIEPARIVRRALVLAAAALAVTAASWFFTPDGLIFFGVLHHLALAGLLGLVFLPLPPFVLLIAAAGFIALPLAGGWPLFDSPWLSWVGLVTHEPRTNDFVPLFPWFGAVLAGMAAARLALARGSLRQSAPTRGPAGALCWAGRHSLAIYLIHQPLLFGAMLALATLGGVGDAGGRLVPVPESGLPARSAGFLGSCQVSCEKSGGALTTCAGYCRCVAIRLDAEGLWPRFQANQLDAAGQRTLMATIQDCANHSRGLQP